MRAKQPARKRRISADDLCRYKVIVSAAISPDEKQVAYTVETISKDRKKYFSHLHLVDIASGESRQFTFGEVKDGRPVWSPDGRWIAFVSTRNKKSGLYVIASEGGAERKIIEADGSFGSPVWTPDGRELVYVFRYNDSHEIKDEKKKTEPPVYRHITRLLYRVDGEGFLPRDRYHIWKVSVADGKATQLSRGRYDDVQPSVSPDGRQVVFTSRRSKDPDTGLALFELLRVPTGGGKATVISTPPGLKLFPVFSPDGRTIAYLGHDKPNNKKGPTNVHLWSVGVSGRPAARDLIPDFDRTLENLTLTDTGGGDFMMAPQWSKDGRRLFFNADDTGSHHLFSVSASGGRPVRITTSKCHVKEFSMGRSRRVIAAVVGDLKSPGDVTVMPASGGGDAKAKTLTALNRRLLQARSIPAVREVWFNGYDGTRLQGWLVTPPNFKRNRRYPGILQIHGGPRCQYGYSFFHEMLWLASRGYVVFYTNPRGGGGRGEPFAQAIYAAWGSVDYDDCMAATDYLAGLAYVDEKRLGVTGGSYGGYMTNWIIGHTDRFRAAVTQRSLFNLVSDLGASDFGYNLYRTFVDHPWKVPEIYRKCSPITYAENIRTPVLIIHSESDLRCRTEQGEQMFAMLKLMKKTVEMVRFPGEPHGLSRHGRPDRRIARLEWILKWFDRYLTGRRTRH